MGKSPGLGPPVGEHRGGRWPGWGGGDAVEGFAGYERGSVDVGLNFLVGELNGCWCEWDRGLCVSHSSGCGTSTGPLGDLLLC